MSIEGTVSAINALYPEKENTTKAVSTPERCFWTTYAWRSEGLFFDETGIDTIQHCQTGYPTEKQLQKFSKKHFFSGESNYMTYPCKIKILAHSELSNEHMKTLLNKS
jgi:hypothetical protein